MCCNIFYITFIILSVLNTEPGIYTTTTWCHQVTQNKLVTIIVTWKGNVPAVVVHLVALIALLQLQVSQQADLSTVGWLLVVLGVGLWEEGGGSLGRFLTFGP